MLSQPSGRSMVGRVSADAGVQVRTRRGCVDRHFACTCRTAAAPHARRAGSRLQRRTARLAQPLLSACRQELGSNQERPSVKVAIVVPFRQQLPLQDRRAQLDRFLPHMEAFLSAIHSCAFVIVVVEQSDDGRKFNRGQLLNVGFQLAEEALPGLTSVITHDVDLLPSLEMRGAYANVPPAGHAVHLASVWSKYSYSTFIGGVLAFRADDFAKVNGYPNNYWGWGLEDDQLALRMSHCGLKPLRVRAGTFEDLDPLNMKSFLDRGQREEIQRHLPWYNAEMFRRDCLVLDHDWARNGLRDLAHSVLAIEEHGCVRHVLVELGPPLSHPVRGEAHGRTFGEPQQL